MSYLIWGHELYEEIVDTTGAIAKLEVIEVELFNIHKWSEISVMVGSCFSVASWTFQHQFIHMHVLNNC